MSKQTQLNQLNKKMLACKKCALCATCQQVVPGEGSANAKILFIGEGPGKKEDELGRPFVGSAGKFLDEMLAIIKLKREDVYIANIVKCRPPENRDPLPQEAITCWPWLLEQIKIIQPKLIVTLGRHSMERFLPNHKISQMHGTLVIKTIPEIGKQNFYTLYHPAAALYNGSMRKTLITDFKKIPNVLEKIKQEK
ncbi:MAG: Phage SPO1 DNA polymerase-related protein [Candidatus Moranbacteria bacterium GW2011_GWF2_36_839]|nr:MAG: Phage SPO1 DNA polymerase-related protein [Candidatus Moranbacteria bacterium GW2011_GWF1_36_78]KKQ16713.1 MAG: Phage SPO1 DNA polymerase-related protein [Candidatus Moranbacteria bacterium GW2011_GWF2_36_839]HAT74227.1 uracil-DNA glycosylase [Candidatus Moranbacteria bacterium]HBY11405.1 uracil-DNA glycosylase [Candidatus Moranbacteria bacterium]